MAELSGDRRLSEIFRQYGQLKKYNPGQLLIEKGQPAALQLLSGQLDMPALSASTLRETISPCSISSRTT